MPQTKSRNRIAAITAFLLAFIPLAGLAAGGPLTVRGTITAVDGDTLNVKASDGTAAKIQLAANAAVLSVAKADLSDIKPGDYVGAAATPRTDGTLQAIEIHIFPKSMQGAGEGTRAWDRAAKGSMTNGLVGRPSGRVTDNKVNAVATDRITVDYKGGSKTVLVTPSTTIVRLEPGDRSQLKPDAQVVVVGATRNGDGSLSAGRITVGSKNLPPPM